MGVPSAASDFDAFAKEQKRFLCLSSSSAFCPLISNAERKQPDNSFLLSGKEFAH
jgi:hypothetical protein